MGKEILSVWRLILSRYDITLARYELKLNIECMEFIFSISRVLNRALYGNEIALAIGLFVVESGVAR